MFEEETPGEGTESDMPNSEDQHTNLKSGVSFPQSRSNEAWQTRAKEIARLVNVMLSVSAESRNEGRVFVLAKALQDKLDSESPHSNQGEGVGSSAGMAAVREMAALLSGASHGLLPPELLIRDDDALDSAYEESGDEEPAERTTNSMFSAPRVTKAAQRRLRRQSRVSYPKPRGMTESEAHLWRGAGLQTALEDTGLRQEEIERLIQELDQVVPPDIAHSE